MMAGAYLDAETARDLARAARSRNAVADPTRFDDDAVLREGLLEHGVASSAVDALARVARDHPALPRALREVYADRKRGDDASPLAHALWMFVSDMIAALVPVVPFAIWPIAQASYVSIGATAVVLIVLGIARARIGKRRMLSTTLQTLGIAAAAGVAGRTRRAALSLDAGGGGPRAPPAIADRAGRHDHDRRQEQLSLDVSEVAQELFRRLAGHPAGTDPAGAPQQRADRIDETEREPRHVRRADDGGTRGAHAVHEAHGPGS
jgi:hypothetical protein